MGADVRRRHPAGAGLEGERRRLDRRRHTSGSRRGGRYGRERGQARGAQARCEGERGGLGGGRGGAGSGRGGRLGRERGPRGHGRRGRSGLRRGQRRQGGLRARGDAGAFGYRLEQHRSQDRAAAGSDPAVAGRQSAGGAHRRRLRQAGGGDPAGAASGARVPGRVALHRPRAPGHVPRAASPRAGAPHRDVRGGGGGSSRRSGPRSSGAWTRPPTSTSGGRWAARWPPSTTRSASAS